MDYCPWQFLVSLTIHLLSGPDKKTSEGEELCVSGGVYSPDDCTRAEESNTELLVPPHPSLTRSYGGGQFDIVDNLRAWTQY